MAMPLLSFSAPPSSLPKLLPLQVLRNQHQAMHAKCMARNRTCESMEISRRSANFMPNIWHHDFIESIESDYKGEPYLMRVEQLKQEIRHFIKATIEPLACLELIDKIQRLGIGYHFEREVKSALETILVNHACNDDLYSTALRFRLLRQNGYKVTPDVYGSFMHGNTSFKSDLCGDVKGMLSLYEASHLGFEGESIMDEARAFSTHHLKSMLGKLDNKLALLVQHSLELPLHMRTLRLEARWYIDVYEKEEGMNPTLLKLAKLDFNIVQAIYQRDLRGMSRWWKNTCLGEKMSFVRNRLMENFLWTVGVIFDPQFSRGREGGTKVGALITTVDDIYDVYGTLDELELFTHAVDRWDLGAMDQLPYYMKICFLALYNTTNDIAYDTLKQQDCNIIQHLKRSWSNLCKSYLVEATWYHKGYTPTLEEYLENASISVSGEVVLMHGFFLIAQEITSEELRLLENNPKIIYWSSIILRLCDDLATSSAELERGDTPKSIQCYMKQADVSEEIAREYIKDLIANAWKNLNKESHHSSSHFPQPFISSCVNVARMAQCMYQFGDGHGVPDKETKDRVIRLLIEPICLLD